MYDLMNAVNSIFDDSLFFPSMRNIRFNTDGVLDMRPAKWYIWKENEGDEDSKIPVTKGVYAVVKCLGIAEEDVSVNLKDDCVIVQGKTEVKEYVPKCTKANYVLHYVNRYGQVCWMLFSGKQIKSDKITSSKFVQAYDNNYRYNFENVVYQNKVEESWQLTTSYLTDK